jgi:hypothetical protein
VNAVPKPISPDGQDNTIGEPDDDDKYFKGGN